MVKFHNELYYTCYYVGFSNASILKHSQMLCYECSSFVAGFCFLSVLIRLGFFNFLQIKVLIRKACYITLYLDNLHLCSSS